ncbi:MAG: phosphate propanoyltransferase [archaeon]
MKNKKFNSTKCNEFFKPANREDTKSICSNKILIEVSGRHVHLSKEDVDKLFGKGYKLNNIKNLSQPGNYAAKEKVSLINGNKRFDDVRILGPPRGRTQVELSKTDSIYLGLKAPVKLSGDYKNTPGIKIKGPKGEVNLKQGVIVARRHLHVSESQAKDLGIKNKDIVSIKTPGERSLVFNNIITRVGNFESALHLDTDEGNAAGIENITYGELIK